MAVFLNAFLNCRLVKKDFNYFFSLSDLLTGTKKLLVETEDDVDESPEETELDKLNVLIGKTVEEANKFLEKEVIMVDGHRIGLVRPQIVDGRNLIITADLSWNRVNVELKNKKIVRIVSTG